MTTQTASHAKRKPKANHSKTSKTPVKRWSQHVTETSDALDLDQGVFTRTDPKSIATSLKHSAEKSTRKKSSPFRSAMSMLTFYENRAGAHLPEAQRKHLDAAKQELRKLFGKA